MDESLPQSLYIDWEMIFCSFTIAQHAEFPRWSLLSQSKVKVNGFCDASIEAYNACSYVVSKVSGSMSDLPRSKFRDASLKTVKGAETGVIWCRISGSPNVGSSSVKCWEVFLLLG